MTAPERWAQIDELFGEALDRPARDRLEFLAAACGDDRELYEAVLSLLERAEPAGAAIGESVTDFAPDLFDSLPAGRADHSDHAEDAADAAQGRRAGPYRLVAELGRGGMGAVYLAERADGEFEKRVAVKLVKRGMDTDEILRRFQFERRILASLEHPNIATLYDGGATDDGRPYLVMELVDGARITDYCDSHRLAVPERLRLFRQVCAAVQHAHQNLVVHRDLKPSNILVTADGTPKLLDFGIAKLLDDPAGDTPRTRTGMRILTPEYAAPEQVRGDPVTTASDVYALGAVLFELLAGRRPFEDRGRGGGESPEAGTPTRPSVAASRAPADPAAVAAARSSSPERLRRLLQGDLDTVVLKALEEDPRRRYPSAHQLMEEVDRYLEGKPVAARPATLGYRAGKFARRHRLALATASVVLVSLVSGLAATVWQARQAARERDRAEQALAVAEDERDAAEQAASFLEEMFAAANPYSSRPGRMDTMRVGAVLELGADRIGARFRDRPLVRARMQGALGRAYRGLGNFERAEPLLKEALETYRSTLGDMHPTVAEAMNSLANLYLDQERPAEAEALHRQALDLRRQLLDPAHPDVVQSLNNLASAIQNGGRLDEAEPLYDEVLDLHRRMESFDSASYADALNARTVLAFRKDDLDTALPLAREALDINRALFGEEHPRVAQAMNNLAQILSRTGRPEEAEPLLRTSLALNREMLGGEHPNIAAGAMNLASVLQRLGRSREAEPLYLEAIAMNRKLLGGRHPAVAVSLTNYADLLGERDAHAAEPLYREALAINLAAFGPDHRTVGIVSARLAASLCRQGRAEQGLALYRQALEVLRASLPEEHFFVQSAAAGAADCADGLSLAAGETVARWPGGPGVALVDGRSDTCEERRRVAGWTVSGRSRWSARVRRA